MPTATTSPVNWFVAYKKLFLTNIWAKKKRKNAHMLGCCSGLLSFFFFFFFSFSVLLHAFFVRTQSGKGIFTVVGMEARNPKKKFDLIQLFLSAAQSDSLACYSNWSHLPLSVLALSHPSHNIISNVWWHWLTPQTWCLDNKDTKSAKKPHQTPDFFCAILLLVISRYFTKINCRRIGSCSQVIQKPKSGNEITPTETAKCISTRIKDI